MSVKSNNRVGIVFASLLIQAIIIGSMFAYGLFFTSLETAFGWSRTLLSGATSTAIFMMGCCAIFAGRISDRIGPRWVLSASGLAFGVAFVLMYFMTAPWQLFVLYGLCFGIALSTHDVVTLSVIARWFARRRGRMTGIVKTGTAGGQIIMPLAAAALITHFGWRFACVVIGIIGASILIFVAQLMRHPPPEIQNRPPSDNGADNAQNIPAHSHSFTFREARRTRQFWTLCIIQLMFLPILVTIPLHLAVHATDLGMLATQAATVLSTIGACSIIGRLSIGSAIDRVGARNAYFLCLLPLFLSIVFLRFIENPSLLYTFAVLYGIGHGGLFTVVSPAIAEYFGMASHGEIFGRVIFSGTLGATLVPWITGWVFDTFGNYNVAFIGLATLAFIALVLALTLAPLSTVKSTGT